MSPITRSILILEVGSAAFPFKATSLQQKPYIFLIAKLIWITICISCAGASVKSGAAVVTFLGQGRRRPSHPRSRIHRQQVARATRGRKCKMGSRVGGRRRHPFCGANALAKFIATAAATAALYIYIYREICIYCGATNRPCEQEESRLARSFRGVCSALRPTDRPPIPLPITSSLFMPKVYQ